MPHQTLSELAAELWRQQDTKHDYVVDTRRMSFDVPDDGEPELHWDVPVGAALMEAGETPGTAGGPLNEHAHGQLAGRLGIPKPYYDRMRRDATGLLRDNVQHWLYKAPETRMVRMLDGRVRAVLSNRYRRLDNVDLMEHAILPVFARDPDDLQFHAAALTDSRLYLRALTPGRLTAEVKVGDVIQGGVQISNSEVGAGALLVTPFAHRLVCRNGMVSQVGGMRRFHIGREQEDEAYAIYRDDTLEADDAAFFLKVRDAIDAALDDAKFSVWIDQMRDAAGSERMQNPVEATQLLARTGKFTEVEGQSILRHLVEGGDLSRWGLANAVTRSAQDAADFDRRVEMEQAGGAIVEMGTDEWARLARV